MLCQGQACFIRFNPKLFVIEFFYPSDYFGEEKKVKSRSEQDDKKLPTISTIEFDDEGNLTEVVKPIASAELEVEVDYGESHKMVITLDDGTQITNYKIDLQVGGIEGISDRDKRPDKGE